MSKPDFSTLQHIKFELLDINDNLLYSGYMNEKAWSKTIENSTIWEYILDNKRVIEHEVANCIPDVENAIVTSDKITIKMIANSNNSANTSNLSEVLHNLENTIKERKRLMPENSYTTHLFQKGEDKILKKLGEETVEVILAKGDEGETIYESADVLYHLMVYLVHKGISFDKILQELQRRM